MPGREVRSNVAQDEMIRLECRLRNSRLGSHEICFNNERSITTGRRPSVENNIPCARGNPLEIDSRRIPRTRWTATVYSARAYWLIKNAPPTARGFAVQTLQTEIAESCFPTGAIATRARFRQTHALAVDAPGDRLRFFERHFKRRPHRST